MRGSRSGVWSITSSVPGAGSSARLGVSGTALLGHGLAFPFPHTILPQNVSRQQHFSSLTDSQPHLELILEPVSSGIRVIILRGDLQDDPVNHSSSTATITPKPCPKPTSRSSWTLPGRVTPPSPQATYANPWLFFQGKIVSNMYPERLLVQIKAISSRSFAWDRRDQSQCNG